MYNSYIGAKKADIKNINLLIIEEVKNELITSFKILNISIYHPPILMYLTPLSMMVSPALYFANA